MGGWGEISEVRSVRGEGTTGTFCGSTEATREPKDGPTHAAAIRLGRRRWARPLYHPHLASAALLFLQFHYTKQGTWLV